jgi:hypothetical protein
MDAMLSTTGCTEADNRLPDGTNSLSDFIR